MKTTIQKRHTNSVYTDEALLIEHNKNWLINTQTIWEQQSARRDKYTLAKDRSVTVGVTNISYAETTLKSDNTTITEDGLTAEVMDITSYPDRAVIKLKNDLGFDVYLTRFQIMGNRIQQSNGKAGSLLLDQLKRDDDIRRNGEIVKTISNEYIFDATQVATLADYWYKRCGQKKHLYALQVKGSALWYEPGDWYTLALGGAGRNEYIDVTVEIVSVSVSRTNGGIGSTQLIVRECMESWSKTTLYTARLITGASPKRRTNQSNTLIVASSSFDGTYDYRCDGTADDVQIQAAIDYVSSTFGGGHIILTIGQYNLEASLIMKNNVIISGQGLQTILDGPSWNVFIPSDDDIDIRINNLKIVTPDTGVSLTGYSGITGNIDNVEIYGADIGITSPVSSPGLGVYKSNNYITVSNIIIRGTGQTGISGVSGVRDCFSTFVTGFSQCQDMANCIAQACTTGFSSCNNVTNCLADSCTTGFSSCHALQQNRTLSSGSTDYGTGGTQSYADTGTSNACADTAAGGYNS